MNKEEKELIYSVHKYINKLELIELWFLKLFKPKSYKLFIDNLKNGYSYRAALNKLRLKKYEKDNNTN